MAKLGNMSEAPGGGTGIGRAISRITGGITGKGGKNVTPIYQESIPPASVKVIPAMPKGMRKAFNDKSTLLTTRAKSGKAAKTGASSTEQGMKIAKEKALKAEIESVQNHIKKGGKLVPPVMKKSVTRHGVTVRTPR